MTERDYIDQYAQLLQRQAESIEGKLTFEMERYQFWRALEQSHGEDFALRVYRRCHFK